MNFNFIPCPNGKYLSDLYDIRLVTSTASILSQNSDNNISVGIYGGISYGGSNYSEIRSAIEDEGSMRGDFGSLLYSYSEAASVDSLFRRKHFQTCLYTGDNATENSFRNLSGHSPSILHISTHSFYLVGFGAYNDYFSRISAYSLHDQSMVRSGLLMSEGGASIRSAQGDLLSDGVLTSEEIRQLDLTNTNLVVLASCESLIGQSTGGLGGLPKAFKEAGVGSILGSLWKVSDAVTSLLMTEFYKYYLKGNDKYSSLKKAQKSIRKKYPDPYFWAGFVLLD